MEFRTLLLLSLYTTDNTVFIPGGILTEAILMKNSINAKDVSKVWVEGHLFIQPSFRKFWWKANRTDHYGSVWQEYLTTPFNWWSTLDCPTGMTEMTLSIWHNCCPCSYSSVSCLQLPTQTHSGLGLRSVQLECTVPLGVWNFQNFEQEFLLNGMHHKARCGWRSSVVSWVD